MMDIREELISILNTLLEDSEDEISPQVIKYSFSMEIFVSNIILIGTFLIIG